MAYQPTVWTSNDLVTIEKLNKIENGIVNAEARAWNFDLLLNNWDQVSSTEYTYSIINIEDIFAATWVEVNLGTSSQYVTSDIYWETGNNSITFTTSSLPTNNLNVTIVAWGTRAGASSGELIQDGRYPIYSGDLNDINENCILSVQYETVTDANNGHAPVSILGTTHYTVITHFFSNSQKSQLAFSSNTNQVVMRNGIDEWQTVGAEGSGGSDTQVALTNYTLRINSISSLPYTNSTVNDNITSKMVVLESTLSNPAAQTGDWTITTADGYITIEGSISGTTDLILVMGVSNTTAPTIQTNLSSNAAVNLLQDNPKPGVTGILPLGYGGTGVSATDSADLLDKIGVTAAIQQLDSNVNFTQDILSDALTCTATKFFKGVGSSYTGTVPNDFYHYGTFIVTVRGGSKHIIAHAEDNSFAINTYNGSSWTGWRELIALTNLTLSSGTGISFPFTAPHAGILRVHLRAQAQGRVYVIFDSGEIVDGYQVAGGYVINDIPIQKGKTLTITNQVNVEDMICTWYEFNF